MSKIYGPFTNYVLFRGMGVSKENLYCMPNGRTILLFYQFLLESSILEKKEQDRLIEKNGKIGVFRFFSCVREWVVFHKFINSTI